MSGARWAAERVVAVELARALIEDQFPDLRGADIAPFGVGWDNTAYLVGGAWVFRFPRRQVAVPLLEAEVRLLPAIAPRVPLAVPVPERRGVPDQRYGWPFAGYRLLPGRTAADAALDDAGRTAAAASLGAFLAALHAFPVGEAEALGAGGDPCDRLNVPKRAATARADLSALGLDEATRRAVERTLDVEVPPAPRRRLLHGDFYSRHLLVDAQLTLSGVIDWGDVHLGEPAMDLGIAYSFLPSAAREAFFAAYGPVDEDTRRLARYRAAYHGAALTRYAQDVGDAALLAEGLRALSFASSP